MFDFTDFSTLELSVFTKVIHEARFPTSYDDPIVWLTPLVIDWHVAATEESRRRVIERGDAREMENLEKWLRWPNRPELRIFLSRMAEDDRLQKRVYQEGAQYVHWAMRPYILSDEAVTDVVEKANEMLNASDP